MTKNVLFALLNKAQTGNELLEVIEAFANEDGENNTQEENVWDSE